MRDLTGIHNIDTQQAEKESSQRYSSGLHSHWTKSVKKCQQTSLKLCKVKRKTATCSGKIQSLNLIVI